MLPNLKNQIITMMHFIHFLESGFSSDVLGSLNKTKSNGKSSAGNRSLEELFTREVLCPTINRYFRKEIREQLNLTDMEITDGLGTEGFQNCPGFGFTPARQKPISSQKAISCDNHILRFG